MKHCGCMGVTARDVPSLPEHGSHTRPVADTPPRSEPRHYIRTPPSPPIIPPPQFVCCTAAWTSINALSGQHQQLAPATPATYLPSPGGHHDPNSSQLQRHLHAAPVSGLAPHHLTTAHAAPLGHAPQGQRPASYATCLPKAPAPTYVVDDCCGLVIALAESSAIYPAQYCSTGGRRKSTIVAVSCAPLPIALPYLRALHTTQ
jgi:hypothetical protein